MMLLITCSLFSALVFFSSISGGSLQETPPSKNQRNITSKPGENVTLPCRASDSNSVVVVVEWSRSDLGLEHVFLYRNDQIDSEDQHPSFKNRVDLNDSQLRDGDGSLVLRNATTDDGGKYQCRIIQRATSGSMKTVFIINLVVLPPGEPDGGSNKTPHTWGISVVVGVVCVLVCLVGGVIFMKYSTKKQSKEPAGSRKPDQDKRTEMNLIGSEG